MYMHLSVWALKYRSLYKPLSKKSSNVNYNLFHNCILHPEKFLQNIILKCFVWKLLGTYEKCSFALHGNGWLHSVWNFELVFISNQKVTTALKPRTNKLWKKRYNIGPRLVRLGGPIMKTSADNTYSYTCLSWNLSRGGIQSHQNKLLFWCDWLWFMNTLILTSQSHNHQDTIYFEIL